MNDERHNPDFIANVASSLLSEEFGGEIHLRAGETFITNGSVVVRCSVVDSGSNVPASVIVKKTREDEFGYNPDSSETPNSAHWLFGDWAASEFLGNVPSDIPFSPQLYGGSREFGFIVLEDLGDGEQPNTFDALLGRDPELAEQTLLEHISLIGQLHAATIGRDEEYRRIRNRLGTLPKPEKLFQDPWSETRNRLIPLSEVEEAIKLYRTVFENLGIRAEQGVADEIEFIASAVEARPKQFLAFCKGDQNAAGDYIRRRGKPRMFDFGASGLRHALIEGMPGRFTWGCMMRIPERLKPLMDAAYKSQLTQKHSEMTEEVFKRAMIEAGARWHIFHVVHRLPDALSGDRQRGLTTLRQQTFAWLTAFADLYEEFGGMQALGLSARRIAEHLRNLWSVEVCNLPYYSAFKSES
ncbi:MAG: ecdysteroid 22-kinase family protein [Acidobacteria bacterium]|nr:ecdysteroid 22-kinase family protein [Acidobacteriota bacterium]MCA1638637.1 ecdysteroid 22-kinase family protein [Acidobacteriota bacterium]